MTIWDCFDRTMKGNLFSVRDITRDRDITRVARLDRFVSDATVSKQAFAGKTIMEVSKIAC